MKRVILVAALLAAVMASSAYAMVMSGAMGSLTISSASWRAALVAGAGDGNPQAPLSYTLNPGNGRRNFAYLKNFGSENLSSVTLILSGGPANRTVTVATCSGTWNVSNGTCSGTISNIVSGPANSSSGSIGAFSTSSLIHVRISCPQNASGQITTVAIR